MNALLWIARIAAVAGVLFFAVAVLVRLRGMFAIAGYQAGTLLIVGVALMVLGCLAYVARIAETRSQGL